MPVLREMTNGNSRAYDGYDDFDKVKSKTGQESTVFRIRRRIRIPNSANYKIFEIGLKYRIRALRISN